VHGPPHREDTQSSGMDNSQPPMEFLDQNSEQGQPACQDSMEGLQRSSEKLRTKTPQAAIPSENCGSASRYSDLDFRRTQEIRAHVDGFRACPINFEPMLEPVRLIHKDEENRKGAPHVLGRASAERWLKDSRSHCPLCRGLVIGFQSDHEGEKDLANSISGLAKLRFQGGDNLLHKAVKLLDAQLVRAVGRLLEEEEICRMALQKNDQGHQPLELLEALHSPSQRAQFLSELPECREELGGPSICHCPRAAAWGGSKFWNKEMPVFIGQAYSGADGHPYKILYAIETPASTEVEEQEYSEGSSSSNEQERVREMEPAGPGIIRRLRVLDSFEADWDDAEESFRKSTKDRALPCKRWGSAILLRTSPTRGTGHKKEFCICPITRSCVARTNGEDDEEVFEPALRIRAKGQTEKVFHGRLAARRGLWIGGTEHFDNYVIPSLAGASAFVIFDPLKVEWRLYPGDEKTSMSILKRGTASSSSKAPAREQAACPKDEAASVPKFRPLPRRLGTAAAFADRRGTVAGAAEDLADSLAGSGAGFGNAEGASAADSVVGVDQDQQSPFTVAGGLANTASASALGAALRQVNDAESASAGSLANTASASALGAALRQVNSAESASATGVSQECSAGASADEMNAASSESVCEEDAAAGPPPAEDQGQDGERCDPAAPGDAAQSDAARKESRATAEERIALEMGIAESLEQEQASRVLPAEEDEKAASATDGGRVVQPSPMTASGDAADSEGPSDVAAAGDGCAAADVAGKSTVGGSATEVAADSRDVSAEAPPAECPRKEPVITPTPVCSEGAVCGEGAVIMPLEKTTMQFRLENGSSLDVVFEPCFVARRWTTSSQAAANWSTQQVVSPEDARIMRQKVVLAMLKISVKLGAPLVKGADQKLAYTPKSQLCAVLSDLCIGRGEAGDLCIWDVVSVSRSHCIVQLVWPSDKGGAKLVAFDDGSLFGTQVVHNGTAQQLGVGQQCSSPIQEGDELILSDCVSVKLQEVSDVLSLEDPDGLARFFDHVGDRRTAVSLRSERERSQTEWILSSSVRPSMSSYPPLRTSMFNQRFERG